MFIGVCVCLFIGLIVVGALILKERANGEEGGIIDFVSPSAKSTNPFHLADGDEDDADFEVTAVDPGIAFSSVLVRSMQKAFPLFVKFSFIITCVELFGGALAYGVSQFLTKIQTAVNIKSMIGIIVYNLASNFFLITAAFTFLSYRNINAKLVMGILSVSSIFSSILGWNFVLWLFRKVDCSPDSC